MSFNNDISYLIDLAIEENKSYRFDYSDEYKEIYNRVDDKSRIVDYIEEQLGCPLDVLFKPNQKVSFIKDNIIYDNIEIMGVNIQTKEIMLGSSWSFTSLPLNLYGRLWWIKEDRSE